MFYVQIRIIFTWNSTHFHFQSAHFVYNFRYISCVTETTRVDWSKNVSNWLNFIKLSMFERSAVKIYISICGVFHAYSKVWFKYGATTQESSIVCWLVTNVHIFIDYMTSLIRCTFCEYNTNMYTTRSRSLRPNGEELKEIQAFEVFDSLDDWIFTQSP